MRTRKLVVLFVFAVTGMSTLSGCVDAGCTALHTCTTPTTTTTTTTAPPTNYYSPQKIREEIENKLAAQGFTRDFLLSNRVWKKDDSLVHLTEGFDEPFYVEITFPEGKIRCKDIGGRALPDPADYIATLKTIGSYATILQESPDFCKAA